MPKECDECSLCCNLLDVPDLAPGGEWCPHAAPGCGGCLIHAKRPEQCHGFDCFWKAEGWPDELRPDRCHVLFEALPTVLTILVTMDSDYPESWKDPLIISTIQKLVNKGRPVVVRDPFSRTYFYPPEGKTRAHIMADIHQVLRLHDDSAKLHN